MKSKGITLVVMVFIILVILIVVASIIINVVKYGMINDLKITNIKSDFKMFDDELSSYISECFMNSDGKVSEKNIEATIGSDEIFEMIPSLKKSEYKKYVSVSAGKIVIAENMPNREYAISAIGNNMEVVPTITASGIYEDVQTYYGMELKNYETKNNIIDSEVNWRIFHSDKEYVYLISDDYIPLNLLPNTKKGNVPTNNDEGYPYSAQFDSVIKDYNGSQDILKFINYNSLLESCLYYVKNKQNTTNLNIKSCAYMLDSDIWSSFAGDYAEYAIGGPTIKLFIESYNSIISNNRIKYTIDEVGYSIKWESGNFSDTINGIKKEYNQIYVKDNSQISNCQATWIASPSNKEIRDLMVVDKYGTITSATYNDAKIGFRPVVCLKKGTVFEVYDGYLSIKK